MCSPTRCRSCSKTTWAGCGQHVDQVMASVPKNQQCTCQSHNQSSNSSGSLAARLFGR